VIDANKVVIAGPVSENPIDGLPELAKTLSASRQFID
jgi:hypothetical protein